MELHSKRKATVLLDTNFLLLTPQRGLDIFEAIPDLLQTQVEFTVLPQTISELEKLANSKSTKTKRQAEFGLRLASFCGCTGSKDARGRTDDLLVKEALVTGCVLATRDRELRRRARELGIAVVYPRQARLLAVEGFLD